MIVENWAGFILLLVSSALTLLLSLYIATSLRQWSRTHPRDEEGRNSSSDSSAANLRVSHFQVDARGVDARALWETLTRREKQVARLAAQKKSDAEIARELGISEKTVGNHLYNLYGKLEIHSRHELKFLLRALEPPSEFGG